MSIYDPNSPPPAWLPSHEDVHVILDRMRQVGAAAGNPLLHPDDYQRIIDQTADFYHLALDVGEYVDWLQQQLDESERDKGGDD